MNYMLLFCNDGLQASEAEESLVGETISEYIAQTADMSIYGHPLRSPASAKTVRVRNGETLVSDGPFVETKEHIAGFELLECDGRERAVEAAAAHPLAWFYKVEVRPLDAPLGCAPKIRERLEQGPPTGRQRFMLLVCGHEVITDAERETVEREVGRWIERTDAVGARVLGAPLAGPEHASTVRVRGPHTLVSDGPFVESDEFVAGFEVIECADLDGAIAVAAAHPMSWFHTIEVRPFTPAMCGEPPQEAGAERTAIA